jgi:hypothetical protein
MVTYIQTSTSRGQCIQRRKGDKGKEKSDKGKGRGLDRFVYWDTDDIPAHKRQCTEHRVSSAAYKLVDDATEQQLNDTVSIHSRTSARSSASVAHQVHGSNASSLLTSSTANLDPKLYSPTLNSTTIATIMDGNCPTPDQNAESCLTTHPSNEPKRRLHPPRTLRATQP